MLELGVFTTETNMGGGVLVCQFVKECLCCVCGVFMFVMVLGVGAGVRVSVSAGMGNNVGA